MRLFAAVLPPETVLAELAAAVGPVPQEQEGGDGLRWAGRDGWHLTLAFYGEVGEECVPELSERLARGAGRTEVFRLALRGGGRFGGAKGRGGVLWAGVGGDIAVLRRLAERARAAGRKAGAPGSAHRRYHPHLTLARTRTGGDGADPVLDPYVRGLEGFESEPWTVDRVTLFRSHSPTAGVPGAQPRYEQVGSWPLDHTAERAG